MEKPYTHTTWRVSAGSEDEFVRRWSEWVDWSHREGLEAPALLLRDLETRRRSSASAHGRIWRPSGVGVPSPATSENTPNVIEIRLPRIEDRLAGEPPPPIIAPPLDPNWRIPDYPPDEWWQDLGDAEPSD